MGFRNQVAVVALAGLAASCVAAGEDLEAQSLRSALAAVGGPDSPSETDTTDTAADGTKLYVRRKKNAAGFSETISPDPIVIGKSNPFSNTFGENGRTCGTCHQDALGWSITPEFARSRNARDPLFVFDGSDCLPPGASNPDPKTASTLMLDKALVRIDLPIPANADFTLVSFNDPLHCANPPSPANLRMYRRPLPTSSSAFLATVMWDGRENINPPNNSIEAMRSNLANQAVDATLGHAQATKNLPSATQLRLVEFETLTFNAQRFAGKLALDSAGANGGAKYLYDHTLPSFFIGINDTFNCSIPGCAPGVQAQFTNVVFDIFAAWEASPPDDQAAAIGRGERIFNTKSFPIDSVAGINGQDDTFNLPSTIPGFCGTCHDSPNMGNHSTSLPIDIGVTAAHPVGGLDVSRLPTYTFQKNGSTRIVEVTDPGRGLISGKFADIGKTKGPNLRGLATRAPYFHNGSAKDLNAVVDFYDARFHIMLTAQERSDLVAFLSAL